MVLSQKIQMFQERCFCVLLVLLLDSTADTIWQLYIDFCTIRIAFESSLKLCIFKVANLKKLWQLCSQTRHSVLLIDPCDLEQREIEPNITVYKGANAADRTFVHAVRLDLR